MDNTIKTDSELVDLSHMVHESLKAAVRAWPLYVEPRVSEIRGSVNYCVHLCCRECEQSILNVVKGDSAYVIDENMIHSATLAHLLQRHGYEMNGTRNARLKTAVDD